MTDVDSDRELEKNGIELANRGEFADARKIFTQILPTKVEPLHRAQVLQNIMLTYDKEGNKDATIETCNEILAVPGLSETNEGVYLHGQITGYLRRLQGRTVFTSNSFTALFAAYFIGASIGAVFGTEMQGAGFTVFGKAINQDLRYGGACLGAFIGVFLFARIAAISGPVLSLFGGVASAALTAYILLEEDLMLGFAILGILVVMPLFVGSLISQIFKNK